MAGSILRKSDFNGRQWLGRYLYRDDARSAGDQAAQAEDSCGGPPPLLFNTR